MVLKILKMIATSGFLTALECTKFDFGWGSAPYPLGKLTALPRPLTGFKGPISKGEGDREGKREKKENGGRQGTGSLMQIPGHAPSSSKPLVPPN